MLRRPKLVMLGAALQYTVMPGLGFAISRIFQLPPAYAVGCVCTAPCLRPTSSLFIPASCDHLHPLCALKSFDRLTYIVLPAS